MNLSKKTIIISLAGLILLLGGIIAFLLCRTSPNTVKIAFHKIPQEQEEIIRSILIGSVDDNGKTSFKFFDKTEQPKKADIVFTQMGLSADRLIESIPENNRNKIFFDAEIISNTSMSAAEFALNSKGSGNKKVSQVPLYFDGYELLISIQALSETKTEYVSSWTEIEDLASKAKTSASGITFAGGDADTLLAVISAITESFDGKEKYNAIIERIKEYDGPMENLMETLLIEDESFHDAIYRISAWKKKGLINPEILSKTNEDILKVIELYKTAIIIMPLSEHRKLPISIAKYLTTLPIHSNETNFYFPSMRPLNTRSLIAPAVAMISLSKSKEAKKAVGHLMSQEAQEVIAFKTGLAPFLANSKIPDIQSDDLRFWIAATSEPSLPIGAAAFSDEKKKEDFAEAIRKFILDSK
ncbi:hypothetical protein [Treponema sp.]|uniref:hypothetical protein n=1 Tax=Treponema sp. TaxID=166 RepID=UPI003890970B